MNEQVVSLKGLKPSTVAMFEGVFGAVVGVAIAIVNLISGAIYFSNTTNSVLQGMFFGLGIGAFSLLVVPAVYFAVGWVVGYIQGWVLNLILRASGGVTLEVSGSEPAAPVVSSAAATRTQPTFGERIDRH